MSGVLHIEATSQINFTTLFATIVTINRPFKLDNILEIRHVVDFSLTVSLVQDHL